MSLADVDSCFFYDPAVKFEASGTADRDGKFSFRSDTHRKIAYYRMFGDASDGSGHGTHVAASIAGSTDQGRSSLVSPAPPPPPLTCDRTALETMVVAGEAVDQVRRRRWRKG